MGKKPEQLYIDGTEPPDAPAVRSALHEWLDAKEERSAAAERVKLRHDALLMQMAEHKLERYPYVDATTGKRKHVVADKTPRARTIDAPMLKKRKETAGDRQDVTDRALDALVDAIDGVTVGGVTASVVVGGRKTRLSKTDAVESRRVPRTAEHDAAADPFAATRDGMRPDALRTDG
jgi:hypothetical protein